MKPALKWGIAGAAGIAIALAIKNISDENEETAEQTALALQQLEESPKSYISYGQERTIKQIKEFDYWGLEPPENVPGRTLINWYVEIDDPKQAYAIMPYRINDKFGAFVYRPQSLLPVSVTLKVVGIYI